MTGVEAMGVRDALLADDDTTAPSQLPADPYARSAYIAGLFREETKS